MALESSALVDFGCCLGAICAFIGLFVGPCLIWLLHDTPNPYYAVRGTLLNHSACIDMPLWTDGWFALQSNDNTTVARAQYQSTLCTESRWQLPDCCDKLVGVADAFWLQVVRDDGRAFSPSLSRPYLPDDSQSFWRTFGCIVFAASLLIGFIQLVMLIRHIVGVRKERNRIDRNEWLQNEADRLIRQEK